jgi:hypothetical protein
MMNKSLRVPVRQFSRMVASAEYLAGARFHSVLAASSPDCRD